MGVWMCTSLVIGNIIGAGIFLLPASLAPFGWNAVFGWVVTVFGALCLAYVFASLARSIPEAGGPYAYTEQAFGQTVAFLVAWTYWIAIVICNAALAVASIGYLSVLFPIIGRVGWLAPTLAVVSIWVFTLLNCRAARTAGVVQMVTTGLKLVPLFAVVVVAALILSRDGPSALAPFHRADVHVSQIALCATIALWTLIGLESATIPADNVVNPSRTIPIATMLGTLLTGLICLALCSAVILMLPARQLAASQAPLADFIAYYWGGNAGMVLAAFAALSGFGALSGWLLLQGELPLLMARRGLLPQWLNQVSAGGQPVRSHIASSVLLTVLVILNFDKNIVALFTLLVLISTVVFLFAYIFTSLAAIKLQMKGSIDRSPLLTIAALISVLYSVLVVFGAGLNAALMGLVFLFSGLPVFWLVRLGHRPAAVSAIPGA